MNRDLKGKISLVTGGSRGIGKGISLELAKCGSDVAINYVSNKDAALEVRDEIIGFGGNAIVVGADVSDFDDAAVLVKEVEKNLGKVDILVNNAGITREGLFKDMKKEDWYDVINVNLNSVYNCTRAVINGMIDRKWGRVICISSTSGLSGNKLVTQYSAAKAGMIAFSKSLAKEVADQGITANVVAPGFTHTDMAEIYDEESRRQWISMIPVKRWAEPWEMAKAASFLASDDAAYITGQTICVNGGIYM